MRYCLAACLCFVLALVPPASAETLRVVGAGNLASVGEQAASKANGFDTAQVEPAQRGLLVQRAGQSSQVVPSERLAALTPITQRISFMTGRGEQQNEWTGPLLWDVLVASGVIDPAKPAEAVRLAVRITGADGYTAVVALAELAPQFAGRPIQLADRMNGAPIPDQGLRLIVPGDRRGGRSVRDVIRVDVY
jgi:molybdopterin-dependent oxidoreductase-like protein protein